MKSNTENKAVSFTQQDLKRVLGAVCLIILDNGDQALYLQGEYIESVRGEDNPQSLEGIARRAARALMQPLHQVELPVPGEGECCWEDIVNELATRANVIDARATVTLIESMLPGGRAVHFCCHPVLSGSNHDLWFPLPDEADLFAEVEKLMVMNNMANNVTAVSPVREYPKCKDWEVVYNQRLALG